MAFLLLPKESPCAISTSMSLFHRYLNKTDQTISSFARKAEISQNYLSELASGKKLPSYKTAYKIFRASGGEIPMSYWAERADMDDKVSHGATFKSSEPTEQNNA